ncbi:MAG: (d)CMP kinase [Spirochaetota bacterium]
MTVAIDGPAGTGKSTVAQRIAREADLFYLNSGNFYRAITWWVLEHGLPPDDGDGVVEAARELDLDVWPHGIVVDGTRIRTELRSQRVDAHVAGVSSAPGVRDVVNAHLRRISNRRDVIAEGRDMTTVVFPDAEVKVYLDASIDSRAHRRYEELGGTVPYDEVRAGIAERDQIDTTKAVGRLKLVPSALYIDSSHLTINQVCEIVLHTIFSARNNTSTGALGQS